MNPEPTMNASKAQEITEQKGSNLEPDSNFYLACVFCGTKESVFLPAHRNPKREITGFIVTCRKCFGNGQNYKARIEKK